MVAPRRLSVVQLYRCVRGRVPRHLQPQPIKETRWFNFNVTAIGVPPDSTDFGDDRANAPLESIDRLPVARLDRNLLTYGRSHEGKGEIATRMLWEHQDFRNNWGFVGHGVLPPGTSVGYHRHDRIEEAYIILSGSGRMTR